MPENTDYGQGKGEALGVGPWDTDPDHARMQRILWKLRKREPLDKDEERLALRKLMLDSFG
jgi:hypothetical protein